MTRAPGNLLAVRTLLLTHLDNAPGPNDLEPAEVGIVGDPNHRGGYHCGSDRVVTNDYSVVESPRDRDGLSDFASALDVGMFSVTTHKGTFDLRHYSRWIVAQCIANTADTRDIREIIYSPDGTVVKRWDRLGKRTSGDLSHLTHTHESFFRDATEAGRDQRPVVIRYLKEIGLLEDDDMTPEEHNWLATVHKNLTVLDGRNPVGQIYTRMALGTDAVDAKYASTHPTLKTLGAQLAAIQAGLTSLSGKDWTDEEAIVDGVLAGLGARPEPEVALALRAAGVDTQRLAEALLALPAAA